MNNDTRKYIAETLRLVGIGQLAAFAYTAINTEPTRWLVIFNSAAAAVVLIFIGVLVMESTSEDS